MYIYIYIDIYAYTYIYIYIYIYIFIYVCVKYLFRYFNIAIGNNGMSYEVATVSRIDNIIGLFCRIASLLYGSFAKEIYNFIDPTI